MKQIYTSERIKELEKTMPPKIGVRYNLAIMRFDCELGKYATVRDMEMNEKGEVLVDYRFLQKHPASWGPDPDLYKPVNFKEIPPSTDIEIISKEVCKMSSQESKLPDDPLRTRGEIRRGID